MRNLVRTTLLALLVGALAAPLAAQDIRALHSSARQGFWWGFGLGAAQGTLHCDNSCTEPKKYTFGMGDIHLGFTPSPKVALGFEFTGGEKSNAFLQGGSTVKETIGDANFSAYFYPQAPGNFFLQGGLAAVVWQAKQGSNWDRLVTGGLTLGAGYDFRFGRNASITPVVRGVFGANGDLKDQSGANPAAGTKFKLSFIQGGVSILWH